MTIDLDQIDNLHQSTTPGPWEVLDRLNALYAGYLTADAVKATDAAWIAAMHEAWPELREELKRLRTAVDEQRHVLVQLQQNQLNEETDPRSETTARQLQAQAYERAARVCEQLAERYDKPLNLAAQNAQDSQLECAAAIRRLKEAK